jgi:hypothetical protein
LLNIRKTRNNYIKNIPGAIGKAPPDRSCRGFYSATKIKPIKIFVPKISLESLFSSNLTQSDLCVARVECSDYVEIFLSHGKMFPEQKYAVPQIKVCSLYGNKN